MVSLSSRLESKKKERFDLAHATLARGSDSGLVGSIAGRGAARAEDAQGTPTQSRISPSILVHEEKSPRGCGL